MISSSSVSDQQDSAQHMCIDFKNGDTEVVEAGNILIATGSRSARPPNVSFDAVNVVDSDHILQMETSPRNIAGSDPWFARRVAESAI